jgi:hypothetical protein
MINALSRFGTFKNVSQITSEEYSLPTFSFYKSSYSSKYLSFVGVENSDNTSSHHQLVKLSNAELATYAQASGRSKSDIEYPFLDFGGKYVQLAAGYDFSVLEGKTRTQVANALADPTSAIAKAVVGEANVLTATLCKLTNNQPAGACSSSTITSIESKLGSS